MALRKTRQTRERDKEALPADSLEDRFNASQFFPKGRHRRFVRRLYRDLWKLMKTYYRDTVTRRRIGSELFCFIEFDLKNLLR